MVLHLITGISIGGAEMMLYKLLAERDRSVFSVEVVSLTDIGPIGSRIQAMGIPVRALGMRRGTPNPLAILKLAILLRRSRPDVIQTWMYHADFLGGIVSNLAGCIPVVWNIRHSNLNPEGTKRRTIWTARLCALLSRWLPAHIVCCSEASRRTHTEMGYAADKMTVIPNGFDLNSFKPDHGARLSVRKELGISEDTVIIGLVARFHPQKDLSNFIKAAALLHAHIPDINFLLCGDGMKYDNRELVHWIDSVGLREYFHLLGRRDDVARLLASVDIASSSSFFGEGFPNVVGEAMACGGPCVVTDVGDSALIVGDSCRVVPPKDPAALAAAWRDLIEMGEDARRRLGEAARRRIEKEFNLPVIAKRYETLYQKMIL